MTDNQTRNSTPSSFVPMAAANALAFLLRWLSPDEEQAVQHYQKLRRKLIELFARRGVSSSALEELADDTLERAGRKLATGEVIRQQEPMAYLHGVAGNVLHEYWRAQQQRAVREIPIEEATALEFDSRRQREQQEHQRWLDCLDEFLSSLQPEEESLLRSCYHDNPQQQIANRRAAAKRLNLAETGLRARLSRLRHSLERKVRACVERRQK